MTQSTSYRTPLVGKIARVLDFLGGQEASFPALAKALGMPRTSLYVLLQSLLDVGYVRLLPDGRTYALGFRLYELGTLAAGRISLRDQAMPCLHQLRDTVDLTCHLGCLEGAEAFYLIKLQPLNNRVYIKSWEGKRISLHSSGIGKVLLAWQNARELDRLIAACSMQAITPTTITDPDELRNHLADIRRRQWAADDEEDNPGLRCLAAPVFAAGGDIAAAVSATGPLHQVNQDTQAAILDAVRQAARAITRAIGGTYPELLA